MAHIKGLVIASAEDSLSEHSVIVEGHKSTQLCGWTIGQCISIFKMWLASDLTTLILVIQLKEIFT